MVEMENVSKKYGPAEVVSNVTLRAEAGETLVIIGPSGCGKTTVLKMINRMVVNSSGSIKVNGININQVDPVELRRGIGYVIQQIGLLPHLTVQDNIAFVLQLMGVSRSIQAERAKELIRLVGLHPEYLHKRPQHLSGGQQQRIGVARALAADPSVVLMDEPFGAVDPITRQQLQEMVLALQREMKKTILFVTHDIQEAFKLGSRIAIMKEGKIVKIGTPIELIREKDDFVHRLLGRRAIFDFLENVPVSAALDPTVPVFTLGQNVAVKTERWEYGMAIDFERHFLGVVEKKHWGGSDSIFNHCDADSCRLTIKPEVSVSDAIQIMLWEGYRWLPVVQNEIFIGVVTFESCAKMMRE